MLWISDQWKDYEVLDASEGERLERWGKYVLVRPDPQVIWATPHDAPQWKKYDARYIRSNTGGGHWSDHHLPERWQISYRDYLTFNVKPMNFKHTGVFPEQAANWDFIREKVASAHRQVRVLNLFAYSGGATLAAAAGGAEVYHVDAAKNMVAWAKENGTFTCSDDILACAKDADVVYTDVWASMGQEEEKAEREKIFKNYQINDEVMAAAKPDAMVLHCLPAHREEEITAKVFEAHANEIFDEAENRLHAQKAVLVKLLG